MQTNEELLKPSREHLAHINGLISKAERDMVEAIQRWGKDDADYARQRTAEYYQVIEPLRRERDAVVKVIADYYGMQPLPVFIVPGNQQEDRK